MQRLEVSGAVRPLYGSLGVKGLRGMQPLERLIFFPATRVHHYEIPRAGFSLIPISLHIRP